MGKTFIKNLLRAIKGSLSRYLSIMLIIALGVSFYSGVRAASPDMKQSADQYFQDQNLMDFRVMSTLGLTDKDVTAIAQEPWAAQVVPGYHMDVMVNGSWVINLHSLPRGQEINKVTLLQGRFPEEPGEILVEERFFQEYDLHLGDTLTLTSGGTADLKDTLQETEFEIVGTGYSPLYISRQRQLSSVGNGSVKGFAYVVPENFKGEVYTELYIKVNLPLSATSLMDSEAYQEAIKPIKARLEEMAEARGEARYTELITEAQEKLEEGKQELEEAKLEAEKQLSEARETLESSEKTLREAAADLEAQEGYLEQELERGRQTLMEKEAELKEAQETLEKREQELQEGERKLLQEEAKVADGLNQLQQGKEQAYRGFLREIEVQMAALEEQGNPLALSQLQGIYQQHIVNRSFDEMMTSLRGAGLLGTLPGTEQLVTLEETLAQQEEALNQGKQTLAQEREKLEAGKAALAEGKKTLEEGQAALTAGWEEYYRNRAAALQQLEEGKERLAQGQRELEEGKETLQREEAKAREEIQEAEETLRDHEEQLKQLEHPEWYILGRSSNLGYETYRLDSGRIDKIGSVFPFIFFLVAALVSLTTMTRMVQENRIEIGTFKALGYSRRTIVLHYLAYALSASLGGSLLGISFGFKLFPPLIMNAYGLMYTIPVLLAPFRMDLALLATLLAVIFTTTAAVAATLGELREVPATLLRPKAPKLGKEIMLEKITFLWNLLSFSQKVTARNLFRYKQRLIMTVMGIAACTGLVLTGFGIRSGITGFINRQFNEIYRYDLQTIFNEPMEGRELLEFQEHLKEDDNLVESHFVYLKNGTIPLEQGTQEEAYVVVSDQGEALGRMIHLRYGGETLALPKEGVLITEKLAKLAEKKPGDTLRLTLDDQTLEVEIVGITEQYLQHYLYMDAEYYEAITGKNFQVNSFFGKLQDLSHEREAHTAEVLGKVENVAGISFKRNQLADQTMSMNSINSVVWVLVISAGALAFIVIYNLTNININERKRELATIKLLGFYDHELASYIYRENVILTLMGAALGIPLGMVMNQFVLTAAEFNAIMLVRTIETKYFAIAVLLTLCFSGVINLIMYGKFKKIDMVEALKSAE